MIGGEVRWFAVLLMSKAWDRTKAAVICEIPNKIELMPRHLCTVPTWIYLWPCSYTDPITPASCWIRRELLHYLGGNFLALR